MGRPSKAAPGPLAQGLLRARAEPLSGLLPSGTPSGGRRGTGEPGTCQLLGREGALWSGCPGGVRTAWLWLKLLALPAFFWPQMADIPLTLLPLLLPEEGPALISPISKELGLSQRSELRVVGPQSALTDQPVFSLCRMLHPGCPHEQCVLPGSRCSVPSPAQASAGLDVSNISSSCLEWGLSFEP